jgi:hypothetical protein
VSDASPAHWGNPVVESLEHFYGLPVEDLAAKLTVDLTTARDHGLGPLAIIEHLRAGEFVHLYLDQQHARPVDRIAGTDLPEGHLRAAFTGRELVPIGKGGRRTMLVDGKHLGQDRLPAAISVSRAEVKAALCYAHDLVLEDPFDEEQALSEFVRQCRELLPDSDIRVAPDPELFVANVAAVAELAPLVRTGVVRFSPRRLAMNPRATGTFASNAWDIDDSPQAPDRELVDRMMRVWLHSGGTIVPMFSGERQERRFADTLGLLADALDMPEAVRLRKLARLALPSADGLDMRRMIDVRTESAFMTFRSRQRAALATLDNNVDEAHAGTHFRHEMKAAADEVAIKTRRQALATSLSPKLIGWGVGGIVGAAFDWRVAAALAATAASGKLADFLASSTAQALADASPRSAQALHHHYATLATPPPG